MDGYTGSNDILEKLKYANLGSPTVDLYWGDVRILLEESELEIEKLRKSLQEIMKMASSKSVHAWDSHAEYWRMAKAALGKEK
jgi:hypothetical protein